MSGPLPLPGAAPGRSATSALSIGALGVGLVLLISGAWATAFIYILSRAGLAAPVRLAVIDGLHVFVGMASLTFIAAKVAQVGFRQQVAGVGELLLWHRWISWSLLILYSGVYLTGILLLPGWPPPTREALVNAHLITSVWAALPSAWHVWHHRAWAVPYLPYLGDRFPRRFWAGVAVVALPLLVIGAVPRSLGPLSQTGDGSAWTGQGLSGPFLDRMESTPEGHVLVAGGEGLYIRRLPATQWRRVEFPPQLILALALPRGPVAAYVGTIDGLYAAASSEGPYRKLSLPAVEVHGIAVNPADPAKLWVSSRSGFWSSSDHGQRWVHRVLGIKAPTTAWAVTYYNGAVFGSDGFAVYRWDGTRWQRSSGQAAVVSLDVSTDGQRLFASSMGQGIRTFDGQRWTESDQGVPTHGGGGAIHVTSVTGEKGSRAFAATMLFGVAVSMDGRSWTTLGAGLPRGSVWRVLRVDQGLIAATDNGIYAFALAPVVRAGAGWWVTVVAVAAIAGLLGIVLCAAPNGSVHRRVRSWRMAAGRAPE